MVWTRDYRAGHVKRDFVGDASPLLVAGITNIGIRANTDVQSDGHSGSVFPNSAHARSIQPVASFTSYDVEACILAFNLLGMCITSDGTDPGLALYGQQQSCAGVAGGAVHDEYLIKKGVLVPRTLTIEHQGNASVVYEAMAAYDGTNEPVIRNTNVALPAAAVPPRFEMYDMTINGSTITGKRSITIDFGAEVTQESADSQAKPTVVSLSKVSPVITVRGVDNSWFGSIAGLSGANAVHGTTQIRLKNRNELIASAKHITINFAGLITWDTIFEAGIDAPGETSFRITVLDNGVNDVLHGQVSQVLT